MQALSELFNRSIEVYQYGVGEPLSFSFNESMIAEQCGVFRSVIGKMQGLVRFHEDKLIKTRFSD